MTEQEILDRWKSIAGDASPAPWTTDNLIGFFQTLRPDGYKLAAALDGLAGAEAILERLLAIYRVTAAGCELGDAYFIVRNPEPLSKLEAEQLSRSHLRNMADIARALDRSELLHLLEPLPRMQVSQGQTPWPPTQDSPEALIYEAEVDFIAGLTPLPSYILLLKEAMFYIACDSFLRDYILWPLYQKSTLVTDPFQPYFELWKHGSGIRFTGGRAGTVFVPILAPP
jgi:hypothetical protein